MAFKGKGGRKDGREGRAGEPHAAPQGIRACSLPLSTPLSLSPLLSSSHLFSATILGLTWKESTPRLYFTTPPTSSNSPQCKPSFLKRAAMHLIDLHSQIVFMKIYPAGYLFSYSAPFQLFHRKIYTVCSCRQEA